MKKRILSILLTLCMVLCLVPITVFAAGGAKAILPGTSAQSILKIDKSRLSFAGHEWWVIGQKTDKSNNAPIITLLAVNNDFGDVPFRTGSAVPFENARRYSEDNGYYANNPSDMSQWRKPNEYAGSTLQQKMVSLAEAIPEKEQAVIRPKDITEGITGQEVKAQKLWAFSQEDSIYLYRNSCKYAAQWWTRSSNEVYGYGSWTIHPDGRSGSALNVDYDAAVRPAMEMDLSSVLFISAAEHGKVADLTTPIAEYAGDEWKLTLHDSDRDDFTAKTVLVNGSVLEVEYKNAKVGDNEYISAVIKDADGSISRYTRVVQLDGTTNGTRGRAAIDLTGIDMTGKTLCVFNEQFNGDHKTDYAGALREVKLTDEIDEQFTLAPGGRYYFDLSAMNIPGTANGGNSDGAVSLPDTSLHYVPFTYVGTIEAYKLTSATATTEEYAQQNKYPHSLFVADYAVTHTISWGGLNDEGLIFGKNYASGGVDYTLRAPSVGSNSTGSGESQHDTPSNNEWDRILDKNSGYIQNWNKMYSWGQDTSSAAESFRAYRGYNSARFWYYTSSSFRNVYLGFRPVLELPTDLAADSLKIVELLTGEFMPGEQQNWINIIVKKGESFKAPSAEGLPRPDGISADAQLWWVDENSNFYKPGDTVPADVSALTALWGGFGLFLDRGDGEVEVTPDNYTDIFGDGTASFVLPKGKNFSTLRDSVNLTGKDILEIYSTGRLERYGSVFPNLKLKNADLTSVRLSEEYIGYGSPLFITADGKNTVGSLNGISMSRDTLSILGDGSLTLNSALTLEQYTQYGGGSVTMTDGLTAYYLSIDSGSLTVTGDTQAITLRDQDIGYLEIGDGARLFTGSSAQDAAEADVPELSAEMQEVYQRYLAEDSTLTNEEISALNNALREQFNAIFRQLSGKTYVRITGAWDVTYQPGTNGSGNAVTDIKFYNDALALRGALFTRTGHTQVGWATVDGGEKVYGLDAVYTQNEALTLYPVWSTNQYTITFDTAGGSEIAPITQDYGTNIAAPADPTRDGYTFIGWDREIPETMPAENMTVTAQWEINRYTITFDTAGGSEIAPITQDYGTNIAAPADPTRDGYTFIGWDRDIPETMPAENITLKAKWKDIEKPTGEIIIGTNKWREFLNTLTFGLFFKDTQEVTINASDNSGTVFISYLVTDRDLSETELDSLVYRAYEEPFRIDPNGEYIVYAMLVDESLNITYLRSDRITLDNVLPVIGGIEDGKTYCEAQTVTVDEKYVDTVTVNGTAVTLDATGSFTLAPADGEQKIVVTDKAGNTAEMTVTVNDGHTYGEWVSNGDGTHTRKCTVGGCTGSETKDCSGGKATCKNKAVCEVCGKAYGELDPKNHTDLKHISAKAATEDAEGNTEYWHCEGCGKYYSDKDGTKEIKKADTVTAKLPKSPPTGDNSNLMLWIALLFVSGGVVTGTTVISKKKKHSAE